MKTFMVQVWTHTGERYREVGITNAADIVEVTSLLNNAGFHLVNEANGVVFLRSEKGDLVIVYETKAIPIQELAAHLQTIIATS